MLSMAQILIRRLEDDVKARLQRRARRHGRSTEAEAREILRNALTDEGQPPERLGSVMAARFKRLGLDTEIPEIRDQPVRAARFDE